MEVGETVSAAWLEEWVGGGDWQRESGHSPQATTSLLEASPSDGLGAGVEEEEEEDCETAPATVSRKRKQPSATCWGQLLGGRGAHAPAEQASSAFRHHFCAACQKDGVTIPASRVRVVVSAEAPPVNIRTGGVWNADKSGRVSQQGSWPPHRVVNQTAGSAGPRLVVLRDETDEALKGLIALPCGRDESVVFRIGRTLNPITLPPLRLPPPSPTAEELRAEAAFWRVFDARVGRALSQVGWHAEACC